MIVPSLLSSLAIMSLLAFVIELLKLSISQMSLNRMPARSHHTEKSMLVYILQPLGMPSNGKDSNGRPTPGHPVEAMDYLAVEATSRMV